MDITAIVIDSRSKIHPDWVQQCRDSILNQTVPCDLIMVENTEKDKTIGKCWNEAVKQVKTEWCLFVGDDCYMARDLTQVFLNHAKDAKTPCITSYGIMFDEKEFKAVPRIHTGMWKRDYLLKYPFNEKLKKGIDREYFEELTKRGDSYHNIIYYYGMFDRRHDDHCSAPVKLAYPKEKQDIYVTSSGGVNFISPLVREWKKTKKVILDSKPFRPNIKSDIIWVEWANQNAKAVADYKTGSRKFLRLHSYEAYSPQIFHIDYTKYEKVIFIAKHIKDRVEAIVGEIPNAVVIPVGIKLNGFKAREEINNKIAFAGEISRKKGAGELMLLANSFPNYEFHVAGKYTEDDMADYFNFQKPDNLFIEPYSYNLAEFFKDKTYILNTSIREGNPITVLEGMSYGLKPLVRNWVGAKEIFGDNVYSSLDEFDDLLNAFPEPEKYRKFVEDNYDFEDTYKEIEKLLDG